MENLSLEESLKVIDQVLAGYKGTRQEHVTLISAINVVKQNLENNQAKEKKEKESKKYVPASV